MRVLDRPGWNRPEIRTRLARELQRAEAARRAAQAAVRRAERAQARAHQLRNRTAGQTAFDRVNPDHGKSDTQPTRLEPTNGNSQPADF